MKIPRSEEREVFGFLSMNLEAGTCIIRGYATASCNPVCECKDQKQERGVFFSAGKPRGNRGIPRYLPFFWLDTGVNNVQLLP